MEPHSVSVDEDLNEAAKKVEVLLILANALVIFHFLIFLLALT